MSSAADLVRRLEAGGRKHSDGSFSLDPEMARRKMRQFQLADPRYYLALLVQAARLKGATSIRFTIDSDDMWMDFDGRPFSREELDDLFSALFGERRPTDDARALRLLALAVNGALALNPRHVLIESGEAGERCAAELRPEEPSSLKAAGSTERRGTRIHVRDSFRPGSILDFLRSLGGIVEEVSVLRGACRFASIPVYCNGERLSEEDPVNAFGRLLGRVRVDTPEASGFVGILPSHVSARVELTRHGVSVGHLQREGHGLPQGVRGVLEAPGLQQDLSFQRLVEDDAFERTVRLAVRKSLEAVADMGEAWTRREMDEANRKWVEQALRRAYRDFVNEHGDTGSWKERVEALPIWPSAVDGRQPHPLEDLRAAAEGGLGFARRLVSIPVGASVEPVVLLEDEDDLELFRGLFPGRLKDRTAALEQEEHNRERYRRFRARTARPRLNPEEAAVRLPIDGYAGEVGLDPERDDAALRLIVRGCLLCVWTAPLPVPGLAAVVEGGFSPGEDYDDADRDAAAAAAVLAIMGRLDPLFLLLARRAREAVDAPTARRLLEWLDSSQDAAWPWRSLSALGFPDTVAAEAIRTAGMEPDALAPRLGVGPERGVLHPVSEVPLFPELGGTGLRLVELDALVEEGEPIRYVTRDPGLRTQDGPVLLLNDRQLRILGRVFGPDALLDFSDDLRRAADRLRFMKRDMVQPHLRVRAPEAGSVSMSAHGIKGRMAVVESSGTRKPGLHVRMFLLDRPLAELERKAVWGRLEAAVDVPEELVNEGFTGLTGDGERALSRWLRAAEPLLVTVLCEAMSGPADRRGVPPRTLLLRALRRSGARKAGSGWDEAKNALLRVRMFPLGSGELRNVDELKQLVQDGALDVIRSEIVSELGGELPADLPVLTMAERKILSGFVPIHELDAMQVRRLQQRASGQSFALILKREPLVDVSEDRSGVRLRLGLDSVHQGRARGLRLLHWSGGRLLRERTVGAPTALQGAVDGDPEGDPADLVLGLLDRVMETLCDRFDTLGEGSLPLIRRHVADYLGSLGLDMDRKPAEPRSEAVVEREELVGRLTDLPILETAAGDALSFRRVAEARRRHGVVLTLSAAPRTSFAPADPPILILDDYERRRIRQIVGNPRSLHKTWGQVEAANKAVRNAGRLGAPPKEPLVQVSIRGRGMDGVLYLPSGLFRSWTVRIGARGRLLHQSTISQSAPCAGVIELTSPWWEPRLNLSEGQRRVVGEGVVALYRKAAAVVRDGPESRAAAKLRPRLRKLLLSQEVKQYRKDAGGYVAAGGLRGLVRELRELPLFELRGGRWIHLNEAMRTRPEELDRYDLWKRKPKLNVEDILPKPERRRAAAPSGKGKRRPLMGKRAPARAPAKAPKRRKRGPRPESKGPSRQARLRRAVRRELERLAETDKALMQETRLRRMRVVPGHDPRPACWSKGGIVLHAGNPLVARALEEHGEDPVILGLLTSACYTVVNLQARTITDEHERVAARVLAERLSRPEAAAAGEASE